MEQYTCLKNEINYLNRQNKVSYLSQKDKYKLSVCEKLLSCLEETINKYKSDNNIMYPLHIIFPLIIGYDSNNPFIHDTMIEKLNIIMDGDADISKLSAGGGTRRKYKY